MPAEIKEGRSAMANGRIHESIVECIGNTPLVRLHTVPRMAGIQCDLLVKCEYFNAGGSVKDRIARRMIEKAEASGQIKPGQTTIIEPTSGNTGIGLALIGAVKGYETIIAMSEKMSDEKTSILHAFGARIVKTPAEAASDDPASHISVASRMRDAIKGAVILDQYSNPANPEAHYHETAVEILCDGQCDGRTIDMVVMGAGTGGTVTGVAKRLHEVAPAIKIIGVDPVGSLLAGKDGKCHPYQVEGIGYDFIPAVLDVTALDGWEKTEDGESFRMARDLIRHEGLLCGGSSGSAMVGAIRAIKRHGLNQPGKRVIVVLPDSAHNYMSKFLADDWMIAHGHMEASVDKKVVGNLEDALLEVKAVEISDELTIGELLERMPLTASTVVPVTRRGKPAGVIPVSRLVKRLIDRDGLSTSDKALRATTQDFVTVDKDTPISAVARLCATGRFIFVLDASKNVVCKSEGSIVTVDSIALLKQQQQP